MRRLFQSIFNHKKLAVQLALLCTALILFACFIPSYKVPKVNVPLIDKWVHFFVFAAFAFAWSMVYKTYSWLKAFFIILVAFVLGWLVEVIQGSGLTIGRSFEVMDIVADGIGGIIGAIIFYACYNFWIKSNAKP